MATPLPIHAETLRGYVMHDLGELALRRKSPPQLSDSRKLTAARASEFGLGSAVVEQVAKAAIRDWRATHRAAEMPTSSPIAASYLTGPPSAGVIGVRVVLTITYPGATPPGAKTRASLIMNVAPSASVASIVSQAIAAWNAQSLQTPHGFRSGGKATDGNIVQVVEGGFAQAQI